MNFAPVGLLYHYSAIKGKRRYNIKLWKTFTDCFNCLPIVAVIDEKIFCCHGGYFIVSLFILHAIIAGQLKDS